LIADPYGKPFLQSMISFQQAGAIYNINSWIKSNYKETLRGGIVIALEQELSLLSKSAL
jgi:hypothetical protein